MDRISFLTFRANFPNLESLGKCRSNWTRQELWKAFEHAQRRTVSPTAPGFSETRHVVPRNTSHDHLSASVGPEIAQWANTSTTCDMVRCAEREQAGSSATCSFFGAAPPRPPPAARCRGGAPLPPQAPRGAPGPGAPPRARCPPGAPPVPPRCPPGAPPVPPRRPPRALIY